MGVRLQSPTNRFVAVQRGRRAHARVLCRHHAAPLLAMASMILNDADATIEIVAAALADACRPVHHSQPSSPGTRLELARSVYRRCIGLIATIERFTPSLTPALPRPGRSRLQPAVNDSDDQNLEALSPHHYAVMALTLFGGHDLRQASFTLRMPEHEVARCILEATRRGVAAPLAPARRSHQQFGSLEGWPGASPPTLSLNGSD